MAMTSEELMRDLRDIDWLIGTINAADDVDQDDCEDLRWLLEQQRLLSGLLELRREQRGKKVVSLALWRYGHATAPAA